MGDFIGSIWFFILLGIILIALIGLFIYLRKKEED
jgi:LPXTG-motif cell wall-anchored protein